MRFSGEITSSRNVRWSRKKRIDDGIVHRHVLAHQVIVENRGHGRDVLVAEALVGAREAGVAGLDRGDPDVALRIDHVPGEDFLRQRHGARGRCDGGQEDFLLQARDVEGKQAAVLDDLAGDVVLAAGEFGERNLFAAPDLVDQAEVGRGQHAQVLAVLLVDALDVLGDHELDAGGALGVGRLLAARSFAAPLAAHRAHEPAALDVAALDGQLVAALQAGVGKLAQGLVEVEADVRRGDLVGGNVVAQLGIVLRVGGVPGQVFARQLPLDQLGIFGEKKNAPLQAHAVRTLLDLAL